jgi:hypothetical protein
MLPKKQKKAWDTFYESARYNSDLDSKTTLLIHLAVSMVHGCHT